MAKYSRRKDGRYVYQFRSGYSDDGKRIMTTVYGKTVAELEAKIYAAKEGKENEKKHISVYEYCNNYVGTFKANKSDNTRQMYQNCLTFHVKPLFSGIEMRSLTASDVQGKINSLGTKRRTAEIMLMLLKQSCLQAIEDGILAKNPCKTIELPPKSKKVLKRPLNASEKQSLFTADFTNKEKCFVFLLYGCGIRREEAIGLRTCDVATDMTSITIQQVVTFPENNPVIKGFPKNDTSARTVPVPLSCIPQIKPYIDEIGGLNDSDVLLFGRMSKTVYVRFWNHIREKMKSPELTAHIFRHNYATTLYYSNISLKQAAALMGHASTKMIMDIYAHLDSEKENLAEKLNAVF